MKKLPSNLHLPFQCGNDRILREMNRRYTAAQYLELIRYGREKMPEIGLHLRCHRRFPRRDGGGV